MWKYLSKSTDVSFISGGWKNHLKNSHPSLVCIMNISNLPMLFSSEIPGLKSPFLTVPGFTKECDVVHPSHCFSGGEFVYKQLFL